MQECNGSTCRVGESVEHRGAFDRNGTMLGSWILAGQKEPGGWSMQQISSIEHQPRPSCHNWRLWAGSIHVAWSAQGQLREPISGQCKLGNHVYTMTSPTATCSWLVLVAGNLLHGSSARLHLNLSTHTIPSLAKALLCHIYFHYFCMFLNCILAFDC